ncbi:MAG: TonB family protein [Candidatus Sulfotelmatobacter sp.]
MSHLPLANFPEPDPPEETLFISPAPQNVKTSPPVNSTALLTVLDDAVVSGRYPVEALWQTIADTARILTGADGTAIALQTDGVVICRARSGEIAPPLGSPLNVESGISGECLRTATSLRCDDTMVDDRVDPEVCLALGIRSIAVIPLCDPMGAFGLLEAFSSRARAFTDDQLGSLKNIGEIAESAYEQESDARFSLSTSTRPSISFERYDSLAASPRNEVPLPVAITEKQVPRINRRYWIVGSIAVLLLLAGAIVWWTWHEPLGESAASHSAAPTATVGMESSNAAAPVVFAPKPSSAIPRESTPNSKNQLGRSRTSGTVSNAASRENLAKLPVATSPTTTSEAIVLPPSSSEPTSGSSPAVSSDEPPPIIPAGVVVDSDKLAKIASSPATMPEVEARISQGVTPAVIIRHVAPVYPSMAVSRRLEGSVILAASVGTDGTIGEIKVLHGQPIFATAAIEAVRQWRYTPTMLDGKPIAITREITISFKLP